MQKLLLIDNQFLTKSGLTQVLSELPVTVTAKICKSKAQLFALIEQYQPALLVADPFFDEPLSADDMQTLISRYQQLSILIIFNNAPRTELSYLQGLGLNRFLSKASPKEEIIAAVKAALADEQYLCKQSRSLLSDFNKDSDSGVIKSLSMREKEIILLIAEGLSDTAIAQKLFLSFHTIRTHRKNIAKKLGFSLKNAAELVWVVNSLNGLI